MYPVNRSIDAKDARKKNRHQCTLYITDDNTRFLFNNNLRLSLYNRNILRVMTSSNHKCDVEIPEAHVGIEIYHIRSIRKLLFRSDPSARIKI